MKNIEKTNAGALVELSTAELLILNNVLNEICNGIDMPAFETRVGATRSDVVELLREIGMAIEGRPV